MNEGYVKVVAVKVHSWWLFSTTAGPAVGWFERLDCGHEITARSSRSNAQLFRNVRKIIARHPCVNRDAGGIA